MNNCLLIVGINLFISQAQSTTFTSDANIWDGIYGFINVENNASVHMYGGTCMNFQVVDSASLYLHDGRLVTGVDGSMIGYVEEQGKYYQYGGTNYSLRLTDNAEAFLYGGTLEYIRLYHSSKIYIHSEVGKLYAGGYCDIHIYGYDYQYAQSNIHDPALPLGSTWSNLRIFKNPQLTDFYDIKLLDQLPTTTNPVEWRTFNRVEFHIIPEPCTLSFLALGAFLAGRRRK